MRSSSIAVTAALALVASADAAFARESSVRTDPVLDGAVIGAALGVTALAGLLTPDLEARWARQLLPQDEAVKGNFSSSAASASDLLVTVSVLTPLALQVGQGLTAETGKRSLVYGETIAIGLALNAVTKSLVGRPRPYVYNGDPRVEAYARRQRKDSHLSFYSGHAATAFAAAVSGGYLFAQSTDDVRARTAVWASGLLVAGATANLRVRAGKHFPSDVIVGALVGAGVGLAVPYLHHADGDRAALTVPELIAIAAAPAAGAVVSQLLPMRADITEPISSAQVVPWLAGRGGGLMLSGGF